MNLKDGFEVVTPDEKILIDSVTPGETVCPINGCGKTMRNTSSLRLHVIKTHGEGKLEKSSSGLRKLFACPVKGCPRSADSPRQKFFSILYSLKMHYLSIHGEKRFECPKCSKKFGNYLIFDQHVKKCKLLFHCECGVYYTTKNALLTHARRKNHKIIDEKNDGISHQPCRGDNALPAKLSLQGLLYLPTLPANILPILNNDKNLTTSNPVFNLSDFQPNLIRILPKNNPPNRIVDKQSGMNSADEMHSLCISDQPEEVINGSFKSVSYNMKTSDAIAILPKPPCISESLPKFDNSGITSSTKNNNRFPMKMGKRKRILSKFERNKILLASAEAQKVLSDPLLLSDTIAHYKRIKESNKLKAQTKRLNEKSKLNESPRSINLEPIVPSVSFKPAKSNDVFDELGSSPKKLADTFTQTSLTFQDIEESPKKSTIDTQTLIDSYHFNEYITLDVLKTSDFGMQCQLPACHNDPAMNSCAYPPIDNGTQTEVDTSWLNNFPCSDFSNMETQTNLDELLEYSQTDLSDNEEPLLLDKSIQLDHMIGLNNNDIDLAESINISTQTTLFDSWFNDSLPYESSSTQTDMLGKEDFMNVDFLVERENLSDISSRNHQDILISEHFSEESNQNERNNIETQTSISLYDLLDSSYIEDYLNIERNMMNIETQTYDDYRDLNCKHTINSETQTDYFV